MSESQFEFDKDHHTVSRNLFRRNDANVPQMSFGEILSVGASSGALVVLLNVLVGLVPAFGQANLPISQAVFLFVFMTLLSSYLLFIFFRQSRHIETIRRENDEMEKELLKRYEALNDEMKS